MAELWVNVGSGLQLRDRFENLDNSPFLKFAPLEPILRRVLPSRYSTPLREFAQARRNGLVRRHDCTRPLPYEPDTVDHILCSHMLEHVPEDTMREMLADFHRVLRPGGTLHVIVPDFRRFTEKYVNGELTADEYQDWLIFHPRKPKSLRRRVIEMTGRFGLSHLWHYDSTTGPERLKASGFTVKEYLDTPSSDYRSHEEESLHLFGIA